jgi:hypothetical protein
MITKQNNTQIVEFLSRQYKRISIKKAYYNAANDIPFVGKLFGIFVGINWLNESIFEVEIFHLKKYRNYGNRRD